LADFNDNYEYKMKPMKRIIYFLIVVAMGSTTAWAQNAKVVSAYNYLKSGELDKAREYIDEAILHEKTMNNEKTWRYRGQIYQGLAMSDSTADQKMLIEEATKSFEKGMELDAKGSWSEEYESGMNNVQILALNAGIEAYNDQDYASSRDLFLMSAQTSEKMGRVDTMAIYNGGLAAEQAEDYDNAIKQYRRAAELGYLGPQMYIYMGNLYTKQEKPEEYLAIIQEGRKAYPDNTDLIVYELNYYLQNGKFEEAENNLLLAIEKEPQNKQLYFSLGVVYDNLGDKEKAVKSYEDAISVDPEYFDAVYNLGAMYFNQAVEMNNNANEIKDNKKYDAARAEAKEIFKKAKPHLEKAHEIDPKDMGAMQSLSSLYALLNETEKYQEMKAKLEAYKN